MSDDVNWKGMLLWTAIAVVFAGLGGFLWTEQNEEMERYEATQATVVSSEVDRAVDVNEADRPDITYEYTVEGTSYRSSRITPGPGMPTRDAFEAEEIVEDHPPGKEVTAYYDPANPSEAFLLRDESMVPVLLMGVGGLMILPVLFLVYRRFS